MKQIIAIVVGGVFIGAVGYQFGQLAAIAMVGGWVCGLSIRDVKE